MVTNVTAAALPPVRAPHLLHSRHGPSVASILGQKLRICGFCVKQGDRRTPDKLTTCSPPPQRERQRETERDRERRNKKERAGREWGICGEGMGGFSKKGPCLLVGITR